MAVQELVATLDTMMQAASNAGQQHATAQSSGAQSVGEESPATQPEAEVRAAHQPDSSEQQPGAQQPNREGLSSTDQQQPQPLRPGQQPLSRQQAAEGIADAAQAAEVVHKADVDGFINTFLEVGSEEATLVMHLGAQIHSRPDLVQLQRFTLASRSANDNMQELNKWCSSLQQLGGMVLLCMAHLCPLVKQIHTMDARVQLVDERIQSLQEAMQRVEENQQKTLEAMQHVQGQQAQASQANSCLLISAGHTQHAMRANQQQVAQLQKNFAGFSSELLCSCDLLAPGPTKQMLRRTPQVQAAVAAKLTSQATAAAAAAGHSLTGGVSSGDQHNSNQKDSSKAVRTVDVGDPHVMWPGPFQNASGMYYRKIAVPAVLCNRYRTRDSTGYMQGATKRIK